MYYCIMYYYYFCFILFFVINHYAFSIWKSFICKDGESLNLTSCKGFLERMHLLRNLRWKKLTIWSLSGLGSLFFPPSLSWNVLPLHIWSSCFSTVHSSTYIGLCVQVRAQTLMSILFDVSHLILGL